MHSQIPYQFLRRLTGRALVLAALFAALAGCTKEKLDPETIAGTYTYTSMTAVDLTKDGDKLMYDSTIAYTGQMIVKGNTKRENRGGTEYGIYEISFSRPPGFAPTLLPGGPFAQNYTIKMAYQGFGGTEGHYNNQDSYRAISMFYLGTDQPDLNYNTPSVQIWMPEKNKIRMRIYFGVNHQNIFHYTESYVEITGTK